jgi:hypothetical protein
MSTKAIRLHEVAPAIPVLPVDIINIEYNKKKLNKSPYSNKLLCICNEISNILYKKDFSQVVGKSQNIINKTIESHKNIKYIIIIPIYTEKMNKDILEILEYIKNMVSLANKNNILMKIEYLV